ncbi:MAG: EamA family transporter [Acidimicrobiales bacterium]
MAAQAGAGLRARLEALPPPVFFVVGAVSQYLGAATAVSLFDSMAPPGVALLRVGAAAAALWAWRRPAWRRWTPRRRLLAAAFGVALACMNLAFYLAVERLPLGNAVAIEFLGPITVAALGVRTLRNALALALAVAGVGVLADVELRAANGVGVAFALSAAALWAGYIVLAARVAGAGTDTGTDAGAGGGVDGLAFGGVVGALAIAPIGAPHVGPALTDPVLLLACVGVGIFSNVIPYALDMVVLRRVTQGQFAFLLALLPATAAAVGVLALGQAPTAAEAVGIGLVVLAVAARQR